MGGAASLRLFRIGNFRALWIGQLVSIFGDRFTYLALLALVTQAARDPANPAAELALIPLVSFAPAILFAPWVGALVDGWSRRATLLVSDAARGVIVLAIIPAADAGGLPGAFAVVFLLYLANTFFLPARSAILPDLVPPDRLTEANSVITLGAVTGTIAGALAGGYLVQSLGWRAGFAIDAATYFVSVAALAFLRVERAPRGARPGRVAAAYAAVARDVREGARIAWRSDPARAAIGATTLLWIAGGALHVAVPTLFAGRGVGIASGVGDMLAAAAVGMVAGTLLLAARGRPASASGRIAIGLAGTGVALGVFALLRHPAAPALAAAAAGCFVSLVLVTTEAAIQEAIVEQARSRVFALRDFVARIGVLVSAGAFGLLLRAGWVSPAAAVGAAGGILVLGSAAVGRRRR
jgi:predicted MFS family arabinose efflux permease